MNKFIGIFLVAVLLIGGGVYVYNQSQTSSVDTASTDSESRVMTGDAPKSLLDLLTVSASQECAYEDDMGNSGVAYSSGGKMRGDFMGTANGQVYRTHMITDGTDMYIWSDGVEGGYKSSLSLMTEGETSVEGEENAQVNTVDPNKKVDYSCKSWIVDQSVFAIPSDIEFTDYSKMMESMKTMDKTAESGNVPSKETQCSACDNLPGEAATQCKQALGC